MAAGGQDQPVSGRRARRWPGALVVIFGLVGPAMLGGAAFLVMVTWHDVATGVHADGTVIDLIAERGSDGGVVYYPRARFATPAGEVVEFTATVGSSPPAFDIGEALAVLYDPADPRKARINSVFQLWFAPLILGILGLVFSAVGIGAFVTFRRPGGEAGRSVSAAPAAPVARPASTVERAPRD